MNRVFLDGKRVREVETIRQFIITLKGNDNTLELHSFKGNGKVYIYMSGSNNMFKFGVGNIVNNDIGINYWSTPNVLPTNSQILIGDGNYFNGSGNSIIGPLSTKIVIGNGNLFAGHIKIWGRNDHIIYDAKTKKRLNEDSDVVLGSSNWICECSTILPGAKLGNYSVLALGSILNKPINKDNVLVAGVPAVIKKEGINWSRACNYDEIDYENNTNLKEKGGKK